MLKKDLIKLSKFFNFTVASLYPAVNVHLDDYRALRLDDFAPLELDPLPWLLDVCLSEVESLFSFPKLI